LSSKFLHSFINTQIIKPNITQHSFVIYNLDTTTLKKQVNSLYLSNFQPHSSSLFHLLYNLKPNYTQITYPHYQLIISHLQQTLNSQLISIPKIVNTQINVLLYLQNTLQSLHYKMQNKYLIKLLSKDKSHKLDIDLFKTFLSKESYQLLQPEMESEKLRVYKEELQMEMQNLV
jgi:hypothetical protein